MPTPAPTQAHWLAELKLGFTRSDAATVLSERRHRGPLRVQKALYPEGPEVCQVIVLHPPSGIVGGDQLAISADVGAHACAQLTTPGAGKWYRSGGAEATQAIDFSVGPGAQLEWLPQETIIFDGAIGRLTNRVKIAADSRYLGWEILCLGRRAAGERFARGHLTLHTRIDSAPKEVPLGDTGQPLWIERGEIGGDDPLLASVAGWAGMSVCGTLQATLHAGDDVAALLAACRAIEPADGAEHALSALPGVLVARYLGDHSEAARLWFVALWQVLRPALLGRPAVLPRIWNT
jgi:urease accessory protein